jgi:hypothetical protein
MQELFPGSVCPKGNFTFFNSVSKSVSACSGGKWSGVI